MENYIVKGILIGIVFGVPAGVIGALTIKHTLSHGFYAGFVTGLGSSFADLLYAGIGVFGIAIISDFLLKYQATFSIFGGVLIIFMGIFIFLKENKIILKSSNATELVQFFGTSFVVAITNPATIMAFFVAFSSFGISQAPTIIQGLELVFGILIGTCCWWGILSGIVTVFRGSITERIYNRLNKVLGSMMTLFGVIMIVRAWL